MATGKQGSNVVTVTYDDAGGNARAITNYNLGDIEGVIEAFVENSQAYGDSADESTPTGVYKGSDITFSGFFDTTATTGPHAIFSAPDTDPNGGTRTLTVVYGDSKTFSCETRLISYKVKGSVGKLTRFEAVARPTGAITWS